MVSSNYVIGQLKGESHPSLVLPRKVGKFFLLKADFHTHTVFSDGHVWPDFRSYEAMLDELDAIAITDHVDYQGWPDDLAKDYNRPHEIAENFVKDTSLLVIRGAEISPRVSPYHCNAIFLSDANAIPTDYMESTSGEFVMKEGDLTADIYKAFEAAMDQNAFIFYNHPTYRFWNIESDGYGLFSTVHEDLVKKGWLHGIEIVNGGSYLVEAHRAAIKYDLAVLSNSDVHWSTLRSNPKSRPVTLVLADSFSKEAIKEALHEGRSVAYWDNHLAGPGDILKEIFLSCLSFTHDWDKRKDSHLLTLNIENTSSIPFRAKLSTKYELLFQPSNTIILAAGTQTKIKIKTVSDKPDKISLLFEIDNLIPEPDSSLVVSMEIPTN